MRKIYFFIFSFLVIFTSASAAGYYFYVQLTDKNNSPYSISNPETFLSQRAIERREFYKIQIDSTDLPVNPNYISELADKGVFIHSTTKWLNGVTVLMKDSTIISSVRSLPFVKFAQFTGITNEHPASHAPPKKINHTDFNYGVAETQINLMNGKVLHQNGYLGKNIHIAVIDAGFGGVNSIPAFELMRNENRLIGTKDIVNPNSDIFSEHGHGTAVLSAMAAEINGTFVGTAPKASYLLIRTEAVIGEYPCEPDFWISGIEYADSMGVDIATTSLGYTVFDDSSMNYTYSQMDGNTIRASIAATMAYEKGILLFNSAGNDGTKPWKYIGVPADAEGVITVGAVTKDSVPSSFSSFGPTSDNRIKPELAAMGTHSAIINASGATASSNGTSFSTPILAGITACFLQAAKTIYPTHTLDELKDYIFKSAHLYSNPSTRLGYGIPDFSIAYDSLIKSDLAKLSVENNKMTHKLLINKNSSITLKIPESYQNILKKANLYSISGQLCGNLEIVNRTITIPSGDFQTGIYILKFEKSDQ